MTTSRDAMLAAIHAARPGAIERPDVGARVAAFPPPADMARSFIEASELAGAGVVRGRRDNLAALVASVCPAVGRRIVAMDAADTSTAAESPHSFADTDLFVCEAILGVAENGAVWLPLSRLRHRSALFLATNVIVVLDSERIVSDLHRAYAAIDIAAEGFGVFVSGPSKTADIEQALVIGAHGAKSMTILLLDA